MAGQRGPDALAHVALFRLTGKVVQKTGDVERSRAVSGRSRDDAVSLLAENVYFEAGLAQRIEHALERGSAIRRLAAHNEEERHSWWDECSGRRGPAAARETGRRTAGGRSSQTSNSPRSKLRREACCARAVR